MTTARLSSQYARPPLSSAKSGAPAAYFYKGRVALYAILKTLGIGAGDAVIVPGYTCVVVPAAVHFAGAMPLYADIDPATCNVTLDGIVAAVDASTHPVQAVVVQHTYGLPADMGPILRWAAARDIRVIEDCCHAWGSRYREVANGPTDEAADVAADWQEVGTLGDAAFFSGQWSKPIVTALGGWVTTRHADLAQKLQTFSATHCTPPRWSESTRLAAQWLAFKALFRPALYWSAQTMLRALAARGLMVGSSGQEELAMQLPSDYAKRMTRWQQRLVVRGLAQLEQRRTARRKLQAAYDDALRAAKLPTFAVPAYADPVLLRYSVRVKDKSGVLAAARAERIELGDWFDHPLHPASVDPRALGWHDERCPRGARAAAEIVNLPMHERVRPRDIERAVALLRRFV